ncbi:GNAT family N-acetyltransferase [Myxococcus stipitatus]|uniref:GNAT family N-acetyltransferase n=1 Tax=Myxococcus stipitatus TaxID=83455 RepID=UPI0030CF15CB
MRTENLLLRPIQPQDNPAVAALIRTVMPEFGADGPGFAIHDAEVDTMSAAYAPPRHAYFVVEREGRVVGGGGIAPLQGGDPSVCELRKMYFLPEARGQGAGERLLRQCLAFAREAGFQRCYLETFASMKQAQKLYQRLGFEPLCAPMGHTGHFSCDHWYALDLTKPGT